MTIKVEIKSPKKEKLKKKVKKPVKKTQNSTKKPIKKINPEKIQLSDNTQENAPPANEKRGRGRPRKLINQINTIKQPVSIRSETINLTEKEERFCREYVCDAALNATKSYQRAFPATTYYTASTQASRLLKKPEIRARLDEMKIERAARLEITPERILNEIAKQAFYDPRDFFDDDGRIKPMSELPPDAAAVISNMETVSKITGEASDGMTVLTKIKLPDKRANLELLGKFTKTFDTNAPSPDKRIIPLIESVLKGEMSARDAAMSIQMMGLPIPEVMRIEMSKNIESENAQEETISIEELELRCIAALENRERERFVFVPERRSEVEGLKAGLISDVSFRPVEEGR